MKKGEIILLPFPFTGLSGAKTRPALVLMETEFDVIVSFITTQTNLKEPSDIILPTGKLTGLKKESLLRLNKIATIDKDIVLGKLGEVDKKTLDNVNLNLIRLFDL
ncbi:MAG: type II toxin-antitoxin system PemK/MazF family toxin [Bacteroidales bacterium]|nr:type II toxin-antitoxin system PemK/MazF family toxin [Bacteroidales bacterium]